MKRLFLILISLFTVCPFFAQQTSRLTEKQIKANLKTVKASLKNGTKLDESAKLITDVLKQSPYSADASYYDMAGRVHQGIYESENKNLYLKKKYDTLKLYNAYYDMFVRYMQCDSIECEKQKFSFRRKNQRTLLPLRSNLLYIGQSFMHRRQWGEACRYLELYISTSNHTLFAEYNLEQTDTLIQYAEYMIVQAATQMGDTARILDHALLAERNNGYGEYVLEQLCNVYSAYSSPLLYVGALESGVRRFPKNPYFFAHLVDYYNSRQNFQGALDYAETMVQRDSTNAYYLFVKGYVLQQMERYDDAIGVLDKAFAIDSSYKPTLVSLAYCYFNKAGGMYKNLFANRKSKSYRTTMNNLYVVARGYFEKLRVLYPKERELWYDWLYTIYYRLNLGQELQDLENS
ncbi:MAG: hypothetical protein IKR18_02540 [Bacteroidaceae bacterium]|nr:hypothetical protein [Bacteroidaceae bacterium]